MIFPASVLASTFPGISLNICLSLSLIVSQSTTHSGPLVPKKEQAFVLPRQFTAQAGLGLKELIEN